MKASGMAEMVLGSRTDRRRLIGDERFTQLAKIEEMGGGPAVEGAHSTVGNGPTDIFFDVDRLDPARASGAGTLANEDLTSRDARGRTGGSSI